MCRPKLGQGKDVVLDVGFCVAKGITDLEAKVIYVAALIKKRRYLPRAVPGYLIDTHFEDKEVGDFGMIEARYEGNKLFKIFCMKEPDYVMKIMVIWMTLDELEGESTRRHFIESSGKKKKKQFTYWQPFGINFRYKHQVEDQQQLRKLGIIMFAT